MLRSRWLAFRVWLPLLLALVAFVRTPASAQTSPTCTLLLQGSNPANPLTITAVVNCVGKVAFIDINWGDDTSTTSSGASITATHTYAATADCPLTDSGFAVAGICEVTVDADQIPAVSGYVDLTAPVATPVFNGQSWDVDVSIFGVPEDLKVTFECTTVTDSSGGVQPASNLGIMCDSSPSTIVFDAQQPQTVSIGINTSGTAIGSLNPAMRRGNILYALLLPLSAFLMLGGGVGAVRSGRGAISKYVVTGAVMLVIAFFSSCGGGFRPNQPVQSTPAGSYIVTIIDVPVPGQNTTGFVQTSLIVPLTVNQVQ
jgi:hypothetical protein